MTNRIGVARLRVYRHDEHYVYLYLDDCFGWSLDVERALILANPARETGLTGASDPPQIITSASPLRIKRNASPIA